MPCKLCMCTRSHSSSWVVCRASPPSSMEGRYPAVRRRSSSVRCRAPLPTDGRRTYSRAMASRRAAHPHTKNAPSLIMPNVVEATEEVEEDDEEEEPIVPPLFAQLDKPIYVDDLDPRPDKGI